MENRIGELRTVHVVYVLSRGGQLEHPHLIRVHPVVRNGVRLKDVKRWLSNLRGKDMPNSFSWSYKRRYKSGYVWQDLRDDDLITPVCDNEYVLKGSQISPIYQDMRTRSGNTPAVQKSLRNKYELSELAPPKVLMLELDSTKGQKNHDQISNCSDAESCKEIEISRSNNNIFLHYDGITQAGNVDTIEYVTKTSGNSPSKLSDGSGRNEAARVYRAIRTSSNPGLDAATQTGDSTRCHDKEETLPLLGVMSDAISPKVVTAKKKSVAKMNSSKVILEDQKLTSKFTCMWNDVVSPASNPESIVKSATKELCQAKAKSNTTASHLLRQLFSCGTIDTRDCGIRTIKAPNYHHAPMDESSDGSAVILPGTPCRKTEYRTNSMNSESFSDVPSAGNLSLTNGGQSDAGDSKRSDRNLKRFAEVAACQKSFEKLHLPSTSSRECSSELGNFGNPSPEGNSYSRVELNESPRASSIGSHGINITKTLAKASTPSKKVQKGSHSSALLLDDFSDRSTTLFRSPRNYSKNSRKMKANGGSINGSPPNVKQNVESCCLQCGRAVKLEYLKAHTKYCRGQRIGKMDAKAKTIMAK